MEYGVTFDVKFGELWEFGLPVPPIVSVTSDDIKGKPRLDSEDLRIQLTFTVGDVCTVPHELLC